MWDSVDYALDWPRALLGGELVALLEHPYRPWSAAEVELLLREAFHTAAPADDFARISGGDGWYEFSAGDTRPSQRPPGLLWVEDLLAHLQQIRQYRPPAPLWRPRQAMAARGVRRAPDLDDVRAAFGEVITLLEIRGYLARDFGHLCVDTPHDEHGQLPHDNDPIERIRAELQQRLRQPERLDLWPAAWTQWDQETFYELIEALHDMVARPCRRWYHEEQECGTHFEDFDTDAGRRVYRALVNRLFVDYDVDLRLATEGEDEGRLVRVVDDARTDLLDRTLSTSEPDIRERVEHAVALYRSRDATEHHKRSAAITLAGILEERRDLIRTDLGRKDEGALFGLANEFAIRHQRRGQQSDYDPAFLDWIFWWYLATIELTDRILARRRTAVTDPDPEPTAGPPARP